MPAAGFGTRFLPVTKSSPKEMLPIINKPVIQYVIEELAEAGIETIILVTGWHKRAIEDYFDYHFELECKLREAGKKKELEEIRRIPDLANFIYVRQNEQRGNGDAVLCAKDAVGDEPFIMLWGDDFIEAKPSRSRQLIKAYDKYQSIVVAGYRTNKKEDTYKYGFAKGKEIEPSVIEIEELIEKPGPQRVPSDMAIVSGFVFTPDIFEALEKSKIKPGEELYWTDGVNYLKDRGRKIYAKEIKNGHYYDCGNILEYLKTNVDFALKREDIKDDFKKYLREKIKEA